MRHKWVHIVYFVLISQVERGGWVGGWWGVSYVHIHIHTNIQTAKVQRTRMHNKLPKSSSYASSLNCDAK